MGKKVLAVFYSQSGQLEQIIDHFTLPFTLAGCFGGKAARLSRTAISFSVDR